MTSFIQEYGTAIRWITIASAVMFVGSLLVVPWILLLPLPRRLFPCEAPPAPGPTGSAGPSDVDFPASLV